MELVRCLFLHRVYFASVLHQRRSLLRHLATVDVPDQDHAQESGRHAHQCLDLAWPHLLRPHFIGMVSTDFCSLSLSLSLSLSVIGNSAPCNRKWAQKLKRGGV